MARSSGEDCALGPLTVKHFILRDKMQILCILKHLISIMAFFRIGECAIDEWVTPTIATGDGGNAAVATKLNNGLRTTDATGITLEASTDATSVDEYSITSQSPDDDDDVTFDIDNNGVLTISSGTLDYSTTTEYVLVILATDDGGATGSASVTVSVQDQPLFAGPSLVYTIADMSPSGSTLATVAATKVNSATLSYTLTSGSTEFAVSSVGLITTSTAMDASILAGYQLVLEADDGTLTGTTTIWVAVTDCTSGATAVWIGVPILFVTLVVSLY